MKKRDVFILLGLVLIIGLVIMINVRPAKNMDDIDILIQKMTLRDKVAQMFIPSFRQWKENARSEADETEKTETQNITKLNNEIREMISKDHFGGILLNVENCEDPEQLLKLTSEIQEANLENGGIPLLIAIDQEGGNVANLSFGTFGTGNMALAASGNPNNARDMAYIFGEELKLSGIHIDYAPVVDVNNNPANPIIGIRAFSDNPETVAIYGKAYMQGLHDAGIIATLKHFPGHGNTNIDSHTGFPRIVLTYDELKRNELIPFQACIVAGADMIMTAHIQYPQIEKETYISTSTGEPVYLPATMSRRILTDILRGDMGFEGVIATDALEMAAVSENFGLEDTILYCINAGNDMILPPTVKDVGLLELTQTMLDMAVKLVMEGKIEEKRINESVKRILKLKKKYGLLDKTEFSVTNEQIQKAKDNIRSKEHLEKERAIAEEALTLLKNDNRAFPLEVKAGEKTLVLFSGSCSEQVRVGEHFKLKLKEENILPDNAEITVMLNKRENEDQCLQAAQNADHVILVHRIFGTTDMEPSMGAAYSADVFNKIIKARHEENKTVIVISCRLPYDAARFPEADAILLTYWESDLCNDADTIYSANLTVGLLACFGQGKPGGKLPVDIPKLDENYQPTEGIMFHAER